MRNAEFGKKIENRRQRSWKSEGGMRNSEKNREQKMENRWNRRSKNCMAPDNISCVSGRSHLTSVF